MSVAPSRNPLPKSTWRLIKAIFREYGVEVGEGAEIVIIDEVGDEYATFAVLYAKER